MSRPAEPASGTDALLAAIAGTSTSTRLKRAVTSYAVGVATWRTGRAVYQRINGEMSYTVAVPGDDDIYADVHSWLLDNLPSRRRRSVIARSSSSGQIDPSPGQQRRAAVALFYDGTRPQTVSIDGHRVRVLLERRDLAANSGSRNEPMWVRALERIVFTARGEAGRDAVLAFLQEAADARRNDPPRLHLCTQWGEWLRRQDVPPRSIESVVLRRGKRDDIVQDLERFLDLEATYARFGLPYHRAYLFHGPPGTGKTSLATALAGVFGLDVFYLPVPSLRNDASLFQALSGIAPKSLLLLEDIDIAHATRVRDDGEPGVTMSGLLNGLDGMVTPHGLITVLTTNNLGVLDEGLVRPGRIDRIEVLDVLDDEQLADLARVMLGQSIDLPSLRREISPAEAIEAMKRHLGDPDAGTVALKELLDK